MIKLKSVSKYYYSKGIVASGISKIDIEFNIGEFVAITGESGSGKSTLLNVISGLDSYEDGEMYINNSETSHYTEKDYENYRRKYIGNIFQNFNLVNSYTVYQNVELVLLLSGAKKKDCKNKVLDLIEKVGLTKFKNTKVSKLSGGQKQRVAIARALAKDTPVIIADEPTGNLDSKSAKEVLEILYDISKEKLVVVVTHNYEQIEKYVTRKVRMHDGKIISDDKLSDSRSDVTCNNFDLKEIGFFNKIRLILRNTFNVFPKFVLLFLVFLFLTVAIVSKYAYDRKEEFYVNNSGYNYYFSDTSPERIILKKDGLVSFNEDDYEILRNLDNVESLVEKDVFIDTYNGIYNDYAYLYGMINNIKDFDYTLDYGNMPVNSNEFLIYSSLDYLPYDPETLIGESFVLEGDYMNLFGKFVLAGIVITDEYDSEIYHSSETLEYISVLNIMNSMNGSFEISIEGENSYNYYNFVIGQNIPQGSVYVGSAVCEKCVGKSLTFSRSDMYEEVTTSYNIAGYVNEYNYKYYGAESSDVAYTSIFLNKEDYLNIYRTNNFQTSIYVEDLKLLDDTLLELESLGYIPFSLRDSLVSDYGDSAFVVFNNLLTLVIIFILFFISYFVVKLILKSRNVYFSTVRILGGTMNIARTLLIGELFVVSSLAFFTVVAAAHVSYFDLQFLKDINEYITFNHYLILYLIMIVMSFLISVRFSLKLFKNSVITTLNEEA